MRVFVAVATGAISRYLVPALFAAGHQVTGTTRSPAKAGQLAQAGATAAVVDGLDRQAVLTAVKAAEPEVIAHQMTDLTRLRNFRGFDKEFAVTNWNNLRTGGLVKSEEDPLDPHPLASTAQSMAAIRHVQEAVPQAVPEGLVLRYGMFYGPGTSDLMLDVAAKRKMPVVDDDPAPLAQWLPFLSSCLGVKPPMRAPAWLGRLLAGQQAVLMMTQTRGAANAMARRELGWAPSYPSWRDGFPAWVEVAGHDAAA